MNSRIAILILALALHAMPAQAEVEQNLCTAINPGPLDPDNLRWARADGAAKVDITAIGDYYPGETYTGTLTRAVAHTNGRTRYNFLFKTPYTVWRQEVEYILIPASPPRDPDIHYLRGVMYTYQDGVRHLDILISGIEVRCTFAE